MDPIYIIYAAMLILAIIGLALSTKKDDHQAQRQR